MNALRQFAKLIDKTNELVGIVVSWLALFIVLVQFIVVVLRYVFGVPSIFMQESIIYMHAVIFMVGAGYTLLHNGHVRVDIFYAKVGEKRQALIDLIGVTIFLLPICVMIWMVSWGYVAQSWAAKEGSVEVSGIQAIFLLKTVILVFATLVAFQGVSLAIHSLLALIGIEHLTAEKQEEEIMV